MYLDGNYKPRCLFQRSVSVWYAEFKMYDRDGNGQITRTELGTVLRMLGQNPTEMELKNIIEEFDTIGQGWWKFDIICYSKWEFDTIGHGKWEFDTKF